MLVGECAAWAWAITVGNRETVIASLVMKIIDLASGGTPAGNHQHDDGERVSIMSRQKQ